MNNGERPKEEHHIDEDEIEEEKQEQKLRQDEKRIKEIIDGICGGGLDYMINSREAIAAYVDYLQ